MNIKKPKLFFAQPNVRCAITARITNLMRQRRSIRLLTKVDEKIRIDRQSALFGVHVQLHNVSTLFDRLGIHFLVPRRVQTRRHVQSFAVQRQLQHLRSALQPNAAHNGRILLPIQFLVLGHHDARIGHGNAAQEHLSHQTRPLALRNVVLTNVAVQPVVQVQILIVERQQNVARQTVHCGHQPIVHLLGGNVDYLGGDKLVAARQPLKVVQVGKQGGAHVTLAFVGIVQETNFQRTTSFVAQRQLLDEFLGGPVKEVERMSAVAGRR